MSRKKTNILQECSSIFKQLKDLPIDKKIETINKIRSELKNYSPFNKEPVDCVVWKKNDRVIANDYNPNSVAPPEMELLRTSINNDGYTQPIVSYKKKDGYEVVDGFHRNRVGKEFDDIEKRIHGYLPLVVINKSQEGKNDRIASTIRHNRARGKHNVDSMSDIVVELKRRNWSDKKISKELGMDEDEILRLCQITGLTDVFSDENFTNSWDIGIFDENEEDNILDDEKLNDVNDGGRIFHTYDKWECVDYGFFNNKPKEMSKEDGELKYKEFLSDTKLFAKTLSKVIRKWKHSCEHNLSNDSMNRIAWLGQAAVCYHLGIPSSCRGGFSLLTKKQKLAANMVAFRYLNKWLKNNDRETISIEESGIDLTVNRY